MYERNRRVIEKRGKRMSVKMSEDNRRRKQEGNKAERKRGR